jgi:soluble lytic murein transglycosylase-like protein
VKSGRHRSSIALLGLLLGTFLGGAGASSPGPLAIAPPGGSADAVYGRAAAALRRRDCAAAQAALAPLAAARGPETAFAALLSGFYAYACGDTADAEERLFTANREAGLGGPAGVLEDWRLYLLADSARARGHVLVARAALARLLGDYPASPLRRRALVKAATLAWEQGDQRRALELVEQGRRDGLHGEEATRLESLAWEIGTRLGDAAVRGEAARHLLIDSPATAAQLGVVEGLRAAGGAWGGGDLGWSGMLNADQLKRRAQALLALQLEPNALAALDAVSAAERDLDWHLLRADVLSRLHRGAEALALLGPLVAPNPKQEAALEWARATAAADSGVTPTVRAERRAPAQRHRPVARKHRTASAPRRAAPPRPHPTDSRRATPPHQSVATAMHRLAAQEHLQKVIALGADPVLAVKALRMLYANLVAADLFDLSIDSLRRLRALDPADTTGAANLWSRGWQEYSRRDYMAAIGYWNELDTLYPNDAVGRRGRYWTARAFEALGKRDRAQEIYREVAGADTDDFYRRNALAHLGRKLAPAAAPAATAPAAPAAASAAAPAPGAAAESPAQRGVIEPWPTDAVLIRARLLTDLGLDDLALEEIALAKERAQPRAVSALEALILDRKRERRKSVLVIREAFPGLGGPHQASLPEEALRLYYPLEYQEPIRIWAAANRVPSHLVFGIIRQESAFEANAVSRAGACGLMQLMPGTAKELARDLGLAFRRERMTEPAFNVQIGTHYLRQVLSMFDDNLELALAGYNGGPYRIKRLWHESGGHDLDRFLEGLSIEESKVYVKRILVLSDSYRQLYPHSG